MQTLRYIFIMSLIVSLCGCYKKQEFEFVKEVSRTAVEDTGANDENVNKQSKSAAY